MTAQKTLVFDPPESPEVIAAFERFPLPLRERLLTLRGLILRAAVETPSVGPLIETLKWGQPAYLPKKPRVGSTVRIGVSKTAPVTAMLFFHCQTRLIETFDHLYSDVFEFEGNRAILVPLDKPVPEDEIRHCVSLALSYHLWK